MTDAQAPRPESLPYRIRTLLCRRTQQFVAPEEHLNCPYCFGRESDVQRGLHERFCGYQPERDPIHFGFPTETERERDG